MLSRAIDRAMDWAVLPGFTSIGYRVRSRGFDDAHLEALAGRAAPASTPTPSVPK